MDSFTGWSFFGSILSSLNLGTAKKERETESEIKLLLDVIIINKPLLLQEGFVLTTCAPNGTRRRNVEIRALSDLDVRRNGRNVPAIHSRMHCVCACTHE